MAVSRIKGTQDFLDLSLYNYIISTVRDYFALYHFTEIATPILEPLELFHRSLGLYSDVVSKEMFVIETTEEKKERICLRPELTASTVRAYIEHNVQQRPWKVFSHGPAFRYERPQKGRFRQFHQCNVEVIGSSSIMQDAQLIKMLERLFHEQLPMNNYTLEINFLGCAADRAAYRDKLYAYLETVSERICATCTIRKEKNIMRVFDCKNPTCQELYREAPHIADHLCATCRAEWLELQETLELLSVSYTYRPTLVRGLDYYDKTVFEFSSDFLGAQSAFCGGGRYALLARELGAKEDQPSVGAAIGLERLMSLLEPYKDRLPLPLPPALHMIIPLSKEQQILSLLLADELQAHGFATDVLLEDDSLKSKLRKANKLGAAYCLLVGEEEQASKKVTVKNMITGSEEQVAQVNLVAYLEK